MKLVRKLAVAGVLAVCASAARADVILDYSPATINDAIHAVYNQSNGQHFYESVNFPQGASVTGMAVYVSISDANEPVYLDFYNNNGSNLPGSSVMHIQTTLAARDSQGVSSGGTELRAYAAFPSAVNMDPGETLWISMAGDQRNLGLYLYNDDAVPSADLYQFDVYGHPQGLTTGDMTMQLYGTVVPEPASLSLVGLTLLAAMHRTRRRD